MLDTTWQDLRYGWRSLLRAPAFTAVVVVTLGLGIGANTAIFTVVDALMLKPLPVAHPEDLVLMRSEYPPGNNNRSLQYPWFERFAGLTQFFAGASAVSEWDRSNVTVNGEADADPGQVRVGLVSGNYFSLLGVTARIGRTLTMDDDRILGGHPVTVISDGYWERRFGRAPDIVGRTLSLRGTSYTILGVTPRGFAGEWVGRPTDVWMPISMVAQVLPELDHESDRGGHIDYHPLARLNPGVRVSEAEAAATAAFQDILRDQAGPSVSAAQSQSFRRARVTLEPAVTGYSPQRTSFAQPLAILMAIVGFVLTIACANVANLLLARSAARRREIAVRLAIGASRGRIVRQLLTESALLAALGGAAGLFFSQWATDILAALVRSGPAGFNIDPVTLTLNLRPDGRVLAFTATLSVATALLFGITPAFRSARMPLSSMLGGRGLLLSGFASRFSLSRLLVIAQVALSLGLVIGAGLFLRTLHNLQSQGVGVDRDHVLLAWTSTLQSGRRVGVPVAQLFETAQQRIASVPGVASASASVYGLLNGSSFPGGDVRVQGVALTGGDSAKAQMDIVMPRYFDTIGMRVLRGRDFTSQDTETSPRVAIVNEAVARYAFGDQDPIGRRIGFGGNAAGNEFEIVGVVSDAQHVTPRDQHRMMYYKPYRQDFSHLLQMVITVRTAGDPRTVAERLRRELHDIDPALPVMKISTISDQINDLLVLERVVATLSGFFGALALLLASLGLYGLIAYTVARRTHEIGLRIALGATRRGVLGMVLRDSLELVIAGIAIGVPATLAATRVIAGRLFGVGPSDPMTVVTAIAAMVTVAAVAGFLPAHRASNVDPMTALRND